MPRIMGGAGGGEGLWRWTEQIIPQGWLHGFLLVIGEVQVKFVEGDISAKSLLMKSRSLI